MCLKLALNIITSIVSLCAIGFVVVVAVAALGPVLLFGVILYAMFHALLI